MASYPKWTIEEIVGDVHGLLPSYVSLIEDYKRVVQADPEQQLPKEQRSDAYWRRICFHDSLIRVRLLIENNFRCIETIALLGTTRYLFEVIVWLKLMKDELPYGLVYYREWIEATRKFWLDCQAHVQREISLLESLAADEDAARVAQREKGHGPSEAIDHAAIEVDRKAARMFSIYCEQATKSTGYSFQAHLVETKVLPDVSKRVAEIEAEREAAKRALPTDVQKLAAPWKWKQQAERVGMKEEYEFIYTFTSRLLHATPVSITTDQKNLERDEVLMFLKYLRVRLMDVLDMASAEFRRFTQH